MTANPVRYAARILDADPGDSAVAPPMWSKTLVTFYETDPEIIAAVLPPPLVPADQPLVRVNVAEVDMPGTAATLGAGVFSVTCKHEGLAGLYDLTMVMTTEQAVTGGREIFGEPKKIGDVKITRDGSHVVGTMTRMGVTYIEVRGDVREQLTPRPRSERTSFYFKFLLDPSGKGFDSDPALVYCTRTEEQRLLERLEGEVILRESSFDPVIDLPVRRIVSMEYSESNTTQRGEIVGTVPGDVLLPYAHQRYDHLAPRRPGTGTPAPGL